MLAESMGEELHFTGMISACCCRASWGNIERRWLGAGSSMDRVVEEDGSWPTCCHGIVATARRRIAVALNGDEEGGRCPLPPPLAIAPLRCPAANHRCWGRRPPGRHCPDLGVRRSRRLDLVMGGV
ncbi:hypothetical protein ACLOJK_029589 [Asimina triloba]